MTLVAAPVALDRIGWKFYLVLICPSVVYITCIYLLFPETKGRTLEEMGKIFGEGTRTLDGEEGVVVDGLQNRENGEKAEERQIEDVS